MIELNTGVPGSGKTLGMVERLAALIARWEKHPEEGRPIFVHGIPNLLLVHSPMPYKEIIPGEKKGKNFQRETKDDVASKIARYGDGEDTPEAEIQNQMALSSNKIGVNIVPDWDLMPDGSLVIIDEAQSCFPPRSSASVAPYHVAWLNVHRHRGFDIWVTTQHPKLVDSSLRALVGKHQHYRRLFGGSRAMVYEWDACSDNLSGMNTAVKTHWSYPKKVFQWYKSAEIHTKQKFKLPLWLAILPVGVLMGFFFFPKVYMTLTSIISGRGLPKENVAASVPGAGGASVAPGATVVFYSGYYVQSGKCFGVLKSGQVVVEPPQCVELAK